MIKNYFSLDEDFETIIKNALPNETINDIKNISTGWTNIVFEVSTTNRKLLLDFQEITFGLEQL